MLPCYPMRFGSSGNLVAPRPAGDIYTSLHNGAGCARYSYNEIYIRMASIRQEKISDLKPNLKATARRIREIRGFDLTQGQFAKILGISQAQLSKYEKAQSVPTVELLIKLKAFSKKPIDWILTGE